MKKFLLHLFLFLSFVLAAQENVSIENPYREFFEAAYQANPTVPRGILEAVAYNATRLQHFVPSKETESCIGIPKVYGVMGLTLDGKNYFHNNLLLVSSLSGIVVEKIIDDPASCIMAYAKAYSVLKAQNGISGSDIEQQLPVLAALSELPDNGDVQTNFALNAHLYSVLKILSSEHLASKLNFPKHEIDFIRVFGETNYKILSSPHVIISEHEIRNTQGEKYHITNSFGNDSRSSDYGPAIWNSAASCNYSSGRSASVSAVAIHTVEGSYAGCISWFKNCSASVSAHYVIRSSDGQITQMVLESNTAYHVAGHNSYTIGIEHEGYVNQTGWYTTALYNASANLVKDICNSGYGINPATCYSGASCACQQTLSTSIKIKGHQHYSITNGKTDPGINWNWGNYYNLLNGITTSCGTPTGLSASKISSTSATLNWSSVSGATGYNIQYKTASGSSWLSTTSTTNSKAISGLMASTS